MRFEENPRKSRLLWVYTVAFLAIFGLIIRTGYLDVVHGESFRKEVGRTFIARLGVLPNRGWIYDCNMRVLAYNAPSVSVILSRFGVQSSDYPDVSRQLAPILHVSAQKLLDEMNGDLGAKEIRLYDNATSSQITHIIEHQSRLPGIHCVEDMTRVYPLKSLAGHMVGYVQPQPAGDSKQYRDDGYLPEEKVGLTGVEAQYERLLQGRPGYRVWQVSSNGVPIKAYGLNPEPTPGQSLRLTFDSELQGTVQQIVMQELEQVHRQHHIHPTDAEAVMLDTRTGGVLAMASYPYYNPNWFIHTKDYEKHQAYINDRHLTPIINHVLASPRYPGSTVKPVNLLAAMQSGTISPNTHIYDTGELMVGTYQAHDWLRKGHGFVDVPTAIQKSCDTFMYQVGMWMANWYDGPPRGESVSLWNQRDRVKGLNQMLDLEWRFGLGPKTGIDLPGEAMGRFYSNDSLRHVIVPYDLRASDQVLRANGRVPNAGLLYDNAFAAIGQMQEFTPMQLAVYAMTLARNGNRLTPHVMDAVLSADGKQVLTRYRPKVAETTVIPRRQLAAVQEGMFRACNRPGGTAYRAFIGTSYRAAGKTGTAEVSQWGKNTDISLFVGYAPAVHPQVAIAVMVPGGGESSDAAVPLARKLLDAYFNRVQKAVAQDSDVASTYLSSPASVDTESGRLP